MPIGYFSHLRTKYISGSFFWTERIPEGPSNHVDLQTAAEVAGSAQGR